MGKAIKGIIKKFIILIGIFLVALIIFLGQDITIEKGVSSVPDAVVVLGGGNGTRVRGAVSLINYFPKKPLVFFTGGDLMFGKKNTDLMKNYAQDLKIGVDKIHTIDTSMSTFDDAKHLSQYLTNNKIKIQRLLIVTSKYHTGRSYWVFKHIFGEQNIEVGIIGTNDYIDHKRWWFDYNMSEIVLLEKTRFLFYRLVGFINPSIIKS